MFDKAETLAWHASLIPAFNSFSEKMLVSLDESGVKLDEPDLTKITHFPHLPSELQIDSMGTPAVRAKSRTVLPISGSTLFPSG